MSAVLYDHAPRVLARKTWLLFTQRATRWRRRLLGLVGAGAGGAAASACSGPQWSLALGAGQNDFSIVVSSASAVAQVQQRCI